MFHHRRSLTLCFRTNVLSLALGIIHDSVALFHDDLCLLELLRQVVAKLLHVVDEVVIVDEDVARERESLGRGHHVLDLI